MAWFPVCCCLLLALVSTGCSARNLAKNNHINHKTWIQKRDHDPFHEECGISEAERQQCGNANNTGEDDCARLGCCYEQCQNCTDQVPHCFLSKRMTREECQVSYEQKTDCGYYGITEGECLITRGCCWAPSPLPNDPPCFKPQSVRIVEGYQSETTLAGRVEIQHEGEWGTVCDDNFNSNAARVVCKSVGYDDGSPAGYGEFDIGSGPILLDGFSCSGTEDGLDECENNGWGNHDCGHSEDAGVICTRAETKESPVKAAHTRKAARRSPTKAQQLKNLLHKAGDKHRAKGHATSLTKKTSKEGSHHKIAPEEKRRNEIRLALLRSRKSKTSIEPKGKKALMKAKAKSAKGGRHGQEVRKSDRAAVKSHTKRSKTSIEPKHRQAQKQKHLEKSKTRLSPTVTHAQKLQKKLAANKKRAHGNRHMKGRRA